MKSFILDCLGAVILVALAALAFPTFTNYRARHEVDGWLSQIQPVQAQIAARATQQGKLEGSGANIAPPLFESVRPDILLIEPDGRIILKGGNSGQMLLLIPSLNAGQIRWTCLGGPDDALPEHCRETLSPT